MCSSSIFYYTVKDILAVLLGKSVTVAKEVKVVRSSMSQGMVGLHSREHKCGNVSELEKWWLKDRNASTKVEGVKAWEEYNYTEVTILLEQLSPNLQQLGFFLIATIIHTY